MTSDKDISFLQWALPKMGYRWDGFKKPHKQVLGRIRNRMHELELTGGYEEYKTYLKEQSEEWKILDQLCDVTISKFFRDRKVWDYIRDNLLLEILNVNKSVSIWSVGCCNGEEAYSLAMIIEHLISKENRRIDFDDIYILATDRNQQVLNRAREGCYRAGSLKELTDQEIKTFFHTNDDNDDHFRIEKRLKEHIEFENRDIQHSIPARTFDLVLSRNLVFTYFTTERQIKFLEKLNPHLKNSGFLVIGSNESMPETEWLKPVNETHKIFRKELIDKK